MSFATFLVLVLVVILIFTIYPSAIVKSVDTLAISLGAPYFFMFLSFVWYVMLNNALGVFFTNRNSPWRTIWTISILSVLVTAWYKAGYHRIPFASLEADIDNQLNNISKIYAKVKDHLTEIDKLYTDIDSHYTLIEYHYKNLDDFSTITNAKIEDYPKLNEHLRVIIKDLSLIIEHHNKEIHDLFRVSQQHSENIQDLVSTTFSDITEKSKELISMLEQMDETSVKIIQKRKSNLAKRIKNIESLSTKHTNEQDQESSIKLPEVNKLLQ